MNDPLYYLARADRTSSDGRQIKGPLNPDGSYSKHTWAFSTGVEIREIPSPLCFAESKVGKQSDFAFTAFAAVLVNATVSEIVTRQRFDVQLIPCQIDDETSNFVLNPIHCIDCIDRNRSIGEYNGDGSVKIMLDLKISGTSPEFDIFRLKGWETAGFVVSERVFRSFSTRQLTGVEFVPVTA